MKKWLFVFVSALMIASCNEESTSETISSDSLSVEEAEANPEMAKLYKEIKYLKKQNTQKDSVLYNFVDAINDIEENLTIIKEKQGVLKLNLKQKTEASDDQKQTIIDDIQLINGLLVTNKNKLAALTQRMNDANIKMADMELLIANLTKKLDEKDAEIVALRDELSNLKIEYNLLQMAAMENEELIEMQENKLNKAFYCFGTSKELKEKGVITKEGGFIGIGKSDKLMENFNRQYFTQIDVTSVKEIDLYVKKAKLVTTHPSDSYEWKTNGEKTDKLIVKDAEKFWSVSKYLVIVTE